MTAIRSLVPAGLALLLLAGCDAGPETGDGDARTPADAPELDQPVPTPGVLAPINQSGVRGRAVLEADGDDRVVEVEVEGLEAGISYSAHVHQGRCVDGGPVRLPMGRVRAADDGTGSTRMRIGSGQLPDGAEYFVQILGAEDRPVACANLETEGGDG